MEESFIYDKGVLTVRSSVRRPLVWLVMLALVLQAVLWTGLASAATPATGASAANKIHRDLSDLMDSAPEAHVRFLVKLGEQADTRRAADAARVLTGGLNGRERAAQVRGGVLRSLKETAGRTQIGVMALVAKLQAQGHISEVKPYWVVNGLWVQGDRVAVQRLAGRAEVSSLRPERRVPLNASPTGTAVLPATTQQWNLDMVKAPQVWAQGIDGTGVVIASLDTGVDWTHPALKQRFRGYDPTNPDMPKTEGNWLDLVSHSPAPYDDQGHGTHTTGTAVGYDPTTGTVYGVAPGAKWIAVKAFDAQGALDRDLLTAGQWLLAPTDAAGVPHPEWAPDVINNSWGGRSGFDEFYRTMVQNWRSAGIFPVFAAGNSGSHGPGSIEVPGNYPEAFAVGAVDSTKSLASFSSVGPGPYPGVTKPNLVAPGVSIDSTWLHGGQSSQSGTSMATPHVTGVVALMLSAAPHLTVSAIESTLQGTATPLIDSNYATAPNSGYGYGLVNALSAVAAVSRMGSISGTVVDAATQAPVAATLTLVPRGNAAQSLAATGAYTLAAPADVYSLSVQAHGYAAQSIPGVTVTAAAQTTLNVALTALTTGTIHGHVKDASTLTPVAGAAVSLAGDPQASWFADANGDFTAQEPIGTYVVNVQAPNYERLSLSVTMDNATPAVLEIALPHLRIRPDDWPQTGGNAVHNGYNDSLVAPPLLQVWASSINPASAGSAPAPVVVAGRVYAGNTADGSVNALDLETGALLWHAPVGSPLAGMAALGNSLVAVTPNGGVHFFDFDTHVRTPGPTLPAGAYLAPVTADGQVYVVGRNAGLYALGLDGTIRWHHLGQFSAPVVAQGKVFIGEDSAVYAYDALSGTPMWQWTEPFASTQASDSVYADGLVLARYGTELYAIDASTGLLRWRVSGVAGTPAVWQGTLYAPGSGATILRFRLMDGAALSPWAAGMIAGGITTLTIANGLLFTGSVGAIDLETGQTVWYFAGRPNQWPVPPVVASGLVLTTADDHLIALRPMSMPSGGILVGAVTDALTGAPIPEATVTIADTYRTGVTNTGGQYSLTGTVGAHIAVAHAYGYVDVQATVSLSAGGSALQNFALAPAPTGTLSGKVVDAVGGSPVEGAVLSLVGGPQTPRAITDAQGLYTLGTFSGPYTLRVRAPGYRSLNVAQTVPAGVAAMGDLALPPAVSRLDDWPTEDGPPDRQSQTEGLLAPPLQTTPAWKTTGVQLRSASRPVIADGRVFAVTNDWKLRAYDLSHGAAAWTQTVGRWSSNPVYDRNRVYVVDQDGWAYGFVADTGEPLWMTRLASLGISQFLTGVGGRLYATAGGASPTVYALDGENGSLLWSRPVSGQDPRATAADGTLFVATGDPRVYAFDAASGNPLWSTVTCNGCTQSAGQNPAVGAGLVLTVESATHTLNALDPATGQLRWSWPGAYGTPAIVDGTVFVNTLTATQALDPATGNPLFTVPVTGRLAAAGGYLYGDGVKAVDLTTHLPVGPYLSGGTGVTVGENHVVVVDALGNLVVLNPSATPPAAATIRGTVLGAGTPAVPVRATVTVAGRQVTSNPRDGTFNLLVPAGTYAATASAPRWLSGSSPPVTVAAATVTDLVIRLDPQPAGTLTGTVMNTATGLPIAGARLSVARESAIPTVISDSAGHYHLQLFPDISLVRVEAAGYQDMDYPVALTPSGTTHLDIALVTGPAGECPMARCDAGRSGLSSTAGRPPYAKVWTSAIYPAMNGFASEPVIARGMVFAGGLGGMLYGLNLQTGAEVWRQTLGTPADNPPGSVAYGDGRVYVANGSGKFQAFDAGTGQLLWTVAVDAGQPTPPVLDAGQVLVGISNGTTATLYAIDAASGAARHWSATRAVQYLATGGGLLFTVAPGPVVTAYDVATGDTKWTVAPNAGAGATDDLALLYGNGVVVVGMGYTTPQLMAFDAASHALLWQKAARSPALLGGTILAYNPATGTLEGYDLRTGGLKKSVPLTQTHPSHSMQVAGNLLLFDGPDLFDLATGQLVWSYLGSTGVSPVAGEGHLVITDAQGRLIGLRGPAGSVRVALALEGRGDSSGIAVTLSGGGITSTGTTGPDGVATLAGIPAGTYALTISHPLYLGRSLTVQVDAAGASIGPVGLAAGDITQDGVIDRADLDTLTGHWGSFDPRYDILGAGAVDAADLYALAHNFGMHNH